jgi:hypothetical protein
MRVTVGIKNDLDKALIVNNSGSIVKINTQYTSLSNQHWGVSQALTLLLLIIKMN